MRVHFWTLRDVADVADWDPDGNPGIHLDGFGHSFLEPYARLRDHSDVIRATIGATAPRGTHVLVASLDEVRGWRSRPLVRTNVHLAAAVLRCPRLVIVRNDLPPRIAAPSPTSVEVVPNRASVLDPARQVPVRPLPQRGLRPRDAARADRIEVMALKAMQANVPEWVTEPGFTRGLARAGVTLRVDTEVDPTAWPDFTDVDLALCVRRHHRDIDADRAYGRKPATKLVNAWCAGAIPLAARESGYLEVGHDARDTIFVDGPEDVLEAARTLVADRALAERVRTEGRRRAEEFAAHAVMAEWERLLSDIPPRTRLTVAPHLVVVSGRAVRAVPRRIRRALSSRPQASG